MSDESGSLSIGGVQTLCDLPEDAVPIEVVEVCGYISPDGKRMFATRISHDVPLSTTLGLLRLAEHHILRESESW